MSDLLKNRVTTSLVLTIIPLLFLIFFFYIPIITIINKALFYNQHFTLQIFKEIFTDTWQVSVILFTIQQSIISLFFTLMIGLPLAYILARYKVKFYQSIKSLISVPFVLPTITVSLGFILFFGNQGYINRFLEIFGFKIKVLYTLKAIILAHVFFNIPIVVRIVGDTIENLNENLLYSARSLGASKTQAFFKVTVPAMIPSILNASILVFIYCFMSFGIILILGHVKFTTIEVNIYMYVRQLMNLQKGIALSFIQIIISLFFLSFYIISNRKMNVINMLSFSKEKQVKLTNVKLRYLIIIYTYLVILCLFIAGPILSLLFFLIENFDKFHVFFMQMLKNEYNYILGSNILTPLINSLVLGLISAFMSVFFSLLLSMGIQQNRIKGFIEVLVYLPLGISTIAFTMGYSLFFSNIEISRRILLICAHIVITLPFSFSIINQAVSSINKNYLIAGKVLGANEIYLFFKVKLPLILKPVITAYIFSFAISFGEISAATMLQDGFLTLPLAIFRFIGARYFYQATVMSMLLVGIASIAFLFSDKVKESIQSRIG